MSDRADRVAEAERIMRASGYEIGTPTRLGARRWFRSDLPPVRRHPGARPVLDALGEDRAE